MSDDISLVKKALSLAFHDRDECGELLVPMADCDNSEVDRRGHVRVGYVDLL